MTARQGKATGALALLLTLGSCTGPISTMRSPYHLRTVEVRNATDEPKVLKIEPTASQHLGAATTFTGILRPGEVKSLYLYHGFEYDFRVLEEPGFEQLTEKAVVVKQDFALVFDGDSLASEVALTARLGEPETTFSDSLQTVDPFGVRSAKELEPDTTRGQAMPTSNREAVERERRDRQGKLQTDSP